MKSSGKVRLVMALMLIQGMQTAGWLPPQTAMGQAAENNVIRITDILLDKPGVVVLGTKTAMSESADVSMLLYFQFPERIPWFYFRDNISGKTAHVRLPYYQTKTVIPKAEHVLTSLKEALTFHQGSSSLLIREYALTGYPLPTSASLRWELPVGDSDSRERSFIQLNSGALLAVWYQQTANADNSLSLGFAYRTPGGQWYSYFPVTVERARSAQTSASIAVAQHPQDDSIWVFCKRDSFHELAAIHLSETHSGLKIDWIDPQFISKGSDGDNGPESERPDLVAVADPSGKSVLLAYQNRSYSFFSTTPFVKGATVTIAEIAADGSRKYHALPDYVERVSRLGLIARNGKAWLAYRPIDDTTHSFDEVYVDSYDFATGLWDGPIFLGSLYRAAHYDNRNESLAFGTRRLDLAAKMADGSIHFYHLDPPLDVAPPSVSIDFPVAGATVSKTIDVRVSASDDTGVARTDLYIDGQLADAGDTAGVFVWDTTGWRDGPHRLRAEAHDAAGNRGSSATVGVKVQNDTTAPIVSILSPADGTTVNDTVTVSVAVSDDVGVVEMNLHIDGALAVIETTPSMVWETTLWRDGRHRLQVTAHDAAGHSGTSSTVTVSVENNPSAFAEPTGLRTRAPAWPFVGVAGVSAILLLLLLLSWHRRRNRS